MITWLVVILLIPWLLGYLGPNIFSGIPGSRNVFHTEGAVLFAFANITS